MSKIGRLNLTSFRDRIVTFDDSGTLMGKYSMLIKVDEGVTQISAEEATKLLKWLIEREMRIYNEK